MYRYTFRNLNSIICGKVNWHLLYRPLQFKSDYLLVFTYVSPASPHWNFSIFFLSKYVAWICMLSILARYQQLSTCLRSPPHYILKIPISNFFQIYHLTCNGYVFVRPVPKLYIVICWFSKSILLIHMSRNTWNIMVFINQYFV